MADPRLKRERRRGKGEASRWGEAEAKRYEAAKHGPDGRRFLDDHLYAALSEAVVRNRVIADIGAGAGPWSEYAQKLGASHVTCLDINPAMLEHAKKRWGEIQPDNVDFILGSAASLPMADGSQDVLLSINVGCNLPETGDVFSRHFTEAYRVAKPGAEFIVTAPDSLATTFTDGQEPTNDIQTMIDGAWNQDGDHSVASAKNIINSLEHCLRATFILDNTGKPVLMTDSNVDLVKSGNPIIRKIPGLAVDNNYHTAEEYRLAAQAAGWEIVKEHNDSFKDESERQAHNQSKPEDQLGQEYIGHPPFIMLKLRKPINV